MSATIGTIVSTEESPSTSEFAFVITNSRSNVKKGLYVQTKNENGIIFGMIREIYRSNRYFERAETISSYENQGSIKTDFPTTNWDYSVAEVRVLGAKDEHKFTRCYLPPSPGNEVQICESEILKSFLGFSDNGLYLGNLQHHDTLANIDLTRLLQKHLAVLAMSGAGKSHLSSVLMEELLEIKEGEGRIATVVIDMHGEYIAFKYDQKYGQNTEIVDVKDMRLPLSKIAPEMLEEWLPNLSPPQKELLRYAMQECKREHEVNYGFSELIGAIDDSDISTDVVKKTLKRSLREIYRYRFISKTGQNPNLIKQVVPGKLLILDFSSVDSLRKKQILVSLLGRKLFSLRKKERIPPFLLLIEEAHNFAREKAEASEAISRSIIETIAREGRKFGASLCLISQRPVNLSTTALSQCATHIILRVTNPNDLDHIQMSSEGIDSTVAKSITGLKTGEAIVVGEAVNHPIFLSVRQRKSVKREKGAPLRDMAKRFEETKVKKEKQVEAFL